MSTRDVFLSAAWDELRKECCVNPKTAVRCVMVSAADFRTAMERALDQPTGTVTVPVMNRQHVKPTQYFTAERVES